MYGQCFLLLIGLKVLVMMNSLQNIVISGAQGLLMLMGSKYFFDKDDQAAKCKIKSTVHNISREGECLRAYIYFKHTVSSTESTPPGVN